MSDRTDPGEDPVDASVVVSPAGAPLTDAAAWVGRSCRAELALHEHLTSLMASGLADEVVPVLWTVRAHRAELAEAWHRRLPELREMPRSTFMASTIDLGLEPDTDPGTDSGTEGDQAEIIRVAEALRTLEARYLDHLGVAVGPADGPVADTLVRAISVTNDDLLQLGGFIAA